MRKKSLIFLLLLAVGAVAGFTLWRTQDARARAAKTESEILKGLSAEELELILKSGDAETAGVGENAEARRAFLAGLREYLALAAEARRAGLADDELFKTNLEHKENILLADLYQATLSREQGRFYTVAKEELEAVWRVPENEKLFARDMSAMREIQRAVARERGAEQVIPKLEGGALAKARENWARVKILSAQARRDAEFMARREVGLRRKILEAGILSADYLRRHYAAQVRATEAEIAAFLKANPQYDVNKKRERAEALLQRALSGEDFAALAAEASEDRASRTRGGLYENIGRDTIWAEVEQAALALERGQVADRVVETATGFHLVKLEKKETAREKNGAETVRFSVRHILLQKNFEEPRAVGGNPDIPPPFVSAAEIARTQIEREKRDRFVAEIVARNPVALPEDFAAAGTDVLPGAP